MAEPTDGGYFPLAIRGTELVPHSQLQIHCDSQAMRYALSVFEGIRGYRSSKDGTVNFFAVDEHLSRLQSSLALVRLPAALTPGFAEALPSLLTANSVSDDCYLRVAVSAAGLGDLQREVSLVWSASLCAMGRKPWLANGRTMAVSISPWRKPSDDMFPQTAKNISNYSGPRIALIEAKAAGFDMTILLSAGGHLAEAPTANLFLVKDGVLLTPALTDGVLSGITRRWVLRIAAELGIQAEERSLSAEDAYSADEAFLCGTGLEFAAIGSFDRRPLVGAASVLPRIVERYFEIVRASASFAPSPRERKLQPTIGGVER